MPDTTGGVEVGVAYVTVVPSAKGFQKQLAAQTDDASAKAGASGGSAFAGGFGKATAALGGVLAGLFAANQVKQFMSDSINAASALAESQGKVSVVFGASAGAVEKWAQTSSTALLMSKQQALEAAGTYGNLFQAFGLGTAKSQEMSTSLVQLAADLASFNNTSVDDALLALRSGLSGETEPLKRFGVSINEARLKQEALAAGLWDGKGALDAGAKSQAAYLLIMQDTKLAQGDVARTSDGYANTMRTLEAAVENAKASIGEGLVSAVQDAAAAFGGPGGLAEAIENWGKSAGDTIGGVALALKTVEDGVKSVTSAIPGTGDGFGIGDILGLPPVRILYNPAGLIWDLFGNLKRDNSEEEERLALAQEAARQTGQDVELQHIAVAAAARNAAAATADYAAATGNATDRAQALVTNIATLDAALEAFTAKSQTSGLGVNVRDSWRRVTGLDKPTVVGGKFGLDASGDAARSWALSLGQQIAAKAGTMDAVDASDYLARWQRRLGRQFSQWGVAKPYQYASTFLPDYQADPVTRAMTEHQRDRAPMQRSTYHFTNTTIITTPGEDFEEKARQAASARAAGRGVTPHGAARTDR